MKKFTCSIVLLVNSIFAINNSNEIEKKQHFENAQAIFESTFLNDKCEPFLNMIAGAALQRTERDLDPQELVKKFKEIYQTKECKDKFLSSYEVFTAQELSDIKKIHDSASFQKYVENGPQVHQANFACFQETFHDLALKFGKEKQKQTSNVIEVTKENFEEIVANSDKPIVMDIYSVNCGPCKSMEPVFKDLSAQYPDLQFVKINCDTQPELAEKYKVTRLPTVLFIKPGQEAEVLQSVGFTSKAELDSKISNFSKETHK
jgi:thioredoxin 1